MSFASSLLATGLRSFLNSKYERYGAVQRVNLDTEKREIDADVLLTGEEQPINVRARYVLAKNDSGALCLTVSEARLSRPWMQALVDDRFPDGFSVDVPPQAAGMLGALL